jgi:hypothetical protein
MCPNATAPEQQVPTSQNIEDDKSRSMEAHRQYLLKQIAESQQQQQQSSPVEVAPSMDEPVIQEPINPLQYRPAKVMAARQRDSPLPASQRVL